MGLLCSHDHNVFLHVISARVRSVELCVERFEYKHGHIRLIYSKPNAFSGMLFGYSRDDSTGFSLCIKMAITRTQIVGVYVATFITHAPGWRVTNRSCLYTRTWLCKTEQLSRTCDSNAVLLYFIATRPPSPTLPRHPSLNA